MVLRRAVHLLAPILWPLDEPNEVINIDIDIPHQVLQWLGVGPIQWLQEWLRHGWCWHGGCGFKGALGCSGQLGWFGVGWPCVTVLGAAVLSGVAANLVSLVVVGG
jgi:hypothetical protein